MYMRDYLKYIPNFITIMRILLIIPIIWLIWKNDYNLAFILIFIAGVSDGVDGFLARYYHWQTPSGAILDPIADKLLLVSLFIVFGLKELLPIWLVTLVIFRDLVIFMGAIAYHFVTHQLVMCPLIISKINTALQIVLVILVAIRQTGIHLPEWLLSAMIIWVAIFAFVSGIRYIILWTRYTLQIQEQDNHDSRTR